LQATQMTSKTGWPVSIECPVGACYSHPMLESADLSVLKNFIARPVCQRATSPIRVGAEIAVQVDDGPVFTLRRSKTQLEVVTETSAQPDLSFKIPLKSLQALAADPSDDIGEVGIALLKLLADPHSENRMEAKFHIGPMELFLRGYLGVLPLGGPSVMKFLANKGFSSLSKIKEGLSRFRG
jgi:hypothetical protein